MASYTALFDELEKIAEIQRKDITKEKLKRHLKVVGAVGLGLGLGHYGGGRLLSAITKKKGGAITKFFKKYPTAEKVAPAIVGAALAGGAGLVTKQHLDYVGKGNGRSKQHSTQ